MQIKKAALVLLTLMILCITACGKNSNNSVNMDLVFAKQVKYTELSRTNNIENKDKYLNDIETFISTGETSERFNSDVRIDDRDIQDNVNINNKYFFNGSIYVQCNDVMYRFQLDENNIIISYIKYELEA